MRAARWFRRRDIRVENLPIPPVRPGQVRVKIAWAGVCGSDIHEFVEGPIFIPTEPHPLLKTMAPQTLGHEMSGIVDAIGEGVSTVSVGDHVAVSPLVSCGKCEWCKSGHPQLCEKLGYLGLMGDGGFAEYMVVPQENCVKAPESLPLEYLAFGELMAVTVHAIHQSGLKEGGRVAVIGGGPLGQLVAQVARVFGASKVFLSEVAEGRLKVAQKVGAAIPINPEKENFVEVVKASTNGQGVDVAFECVGGTHSGFFENSVAQAVNSTRKRGITVILGVFDEPIYFHFVNLLIFERQIRAAWLFEPKDFVEGIHLIASGKMVLAPLITDKISLDEIIPKGFLELELNRDQHIKILVSPQGKGN